MKLETYDIEYCLRSIPIILLDQLQKPEFRSQAFIAGGFIRGMIAGEEAKDIDVFCTTPEIAIALAKALAPEHIKTDNAYTIPGRIPIQIIFKWTFKTAAEVANNFDFSICSAVIWFNSEWDSYVHDRFYKDLAAKRLFYLNPEGDHEAGGSMLRVLKYYRRGYKIPLPSLGAIIARLLAKIDLDQCDIDDEESVATIITGLLVEVDPNIAPNEFDHIPKYDK